MVELHIFWHLCLFIRIVMIFTDFSYHQRTTVPLIPRVFADSGALLWSFCRQVQKLCGAAPRLCWGLPARRKHKSPQQTLPPSPNNVQPVFPQPARHCHHKNGQWYLPRLQPQWPRHIRRTPQETQLKGCGSVVGEKGHLSWWAVVLCMCVKRYGGFCLLV